MFGIMLHLANWYYTFNIVLFAKFVCQKLSYTSKETIGHSYRQKMLYTKSDFLKTH